MHHRRMAAGDGRGGRSRRAARPFLGRRADRAQGSGTARGARGEGRALQQPHHLRRAARRGSREAARRRRPRPRADQLPGFDVGTRRPGGRLQGRVREEETRRAPCPQGRPAADRQRGDAPAEPAPPGRHDRDGGGARCRADRGRAGAVLRMGLPQPRGVPADPRTARRGGADRRGIARAAERRAHLRFRGAGLLRQAPEIVHGRLGPAVHQHFAVGQGAALPCGRGDPRHYLRIGAREVAGRYLGELGEFQPLSRHVLDARAVPNVRPPRDRLGRLPLPSLHADRRRRAHGPGLRAVARPRGSRRTAERGVGGKRPTSSTAATATADRR